MYFTKKKKSYVAYHQPFNYHRSITNFHTNVESRVKHV